MLEELVDRPVSSPGQRTEIWKSKEINTAKQKEGKEREGNEGRKKFSNAFSTK
ncbi:hypothetical protein L484_022616 [Morus notabilis]|uniref:Uncharacterized protein n=1 Tax=Morus notabilis TaxID=981085 RepID=W9RX52_9ROSA|nr:hypothetical protein L484_022616 [Morus notabilis]